MCGFVGYTGFVADTEAVLRTMTDRIIHRGPDADGYYFGDGAALGFRRLSIIDLSAQANQPMSTEDGRYTIVYNGEVYNFMELRAKLEAAGHVFRTSCDTEVLLRGFAEYGDALPDMLRGMFAFAIWDAATKTLHGARDFFGIKPFYYTFAKDGGFIFGSEIKSFLDHPGFVKKLNKNALRPYLTLQYSAQEETFFEGVYKLPPATKFVYDTATGEMKKERFWDINFESDKNYPYPPDECAKRLDGIIRESVEAHRISDVKVGSFLSGGVDSSYITAAQMPDETFSVGFGRDYAGHHPNFDETDEAAELSKLLRIKNYRYEISADDCFDAFADIQYHMDEPQANPSSVPLWFLTRLAREHVTVVLSGEGADEIFAGYEWYDDTPAQRRYKKLPAPLRGAAASVAKKMPYFKGREMIIRSSGRPEDYFVGQAMVFTDGEAEALLTPEYKGSVTVRDLTDSIYAAVKGKTELEKKQYLDIHMWLPGDILLKADKMSMAHSLELRVPYLDRVVMAEAEKIPANYKINGKNTKYILRQAANLTLPDEWANRPKLGFPVPIKYWLAQDKYYDIVKSYFTSDYAAEFFDTRALMRLLDAHREGKENNGRKIWVAFTFLTWYKRFFIDEPAKPAI
jgi:asparagine synthase (glutamine-hydrolysing)